VSYWKGTTTLGSEPRERESSTEYLTFRGRQTRDSLIDAAKVVFSRDGFTDARIADIAAEAGTSHGTFYTYFPSREAVFREVVRAMQADMADTSEARGEGDDPYHRIRRANERYLEAYRRNASLMATLEQVATFNEEIRQMRKDIRTRFVDRNTRAIQRWQAEGLADKQLDARYAANALGAMVDRFVYTWLVLGEEFDQDLAIETLTRIWIQGLGMQPPAKAEVPNKGRRRARRASTEES
jgi:AcrR family transcriptional regulator